MITSERGIFRIGDPAKPADLARAVRTSTLVYTKDSKLVTALSTLIDYKLSKTYVKSVLDALVSAGSTVILYNDPRFINGTTIKFYEKHFNHIHVGVPSASAGRAGSVAPSSTR